MIDDVENIDIGLMFVAIGGTAATYAAGYQRAVAEQPMVQTPEGVEPVSLVGIGLLSIGMLVLAIEMKMQHMGAGRS